MKTLKTFNSNCAKNIVITFISTLLWSSYLFAQGPVKYPSTNGSKMSANEILELGGALQVNVLLIPDTSGVGHGNPPKYYMVFADDQGKFYRGPERRLPGGKPAGVGGGNPNAGACTGGQIWQNTGDDIYKCPIAGNTAFGNLDPKKKIHITSVHLESSCVDVNGQLVCASHQGMRLEDIIIDDFNNQLNSAAWDIEPIASSGNLQIRTPGNAIPVIIFTEDGNVFTGSTTQSTVFQISGAENNGSVAALKLVSPGSQVMLLDGNEIDAIGTNQTLYLNANSSNNVALVQGGGKVRIGSQSIISGTHTDGKLFVNGKIVSKSSFVTIQNWGDYVLHKDYKLPSLLNEVEPYIKDNKHLIGVPSEKEILENGVNLGEMDAIQIVKIEELTLYTIEQQKQIDDLKKEIELLKKHMGLELDK
ncbi:MAG: SlyX family protein [Cytophagales bacterium]|nr:SlyX family protein [Cytophagales bacterium]